MEKHFLDDFVHELNNSSTEESEEVIGVPWYNREGDCIVFRNAPGAFIADRVDEILTLYLSAEERHPIGFQIKDVMALVRKYGYDGLMVRAEVEDSDESWVQTISIHALILAAYEQSPRTIRSRQNYASVLPLLPKPEYDKVSVRI